ncbi:hypothetical protein EGH21_07625 [Halomicroarcula sp. F13]|uniref:RING-type E3 ubiquitin transferase n=1 Tax=Haloarcula rubra TaxID=2487747 RepID=A0AAW4PQF9_9EURY|nr:hypothetical protein [Halomicroarcula rubra]MBX0322899.1 hypothetical protein [Halomicroarcula rubra]
MRFRLSDYSGSVVDPSEATLRLNEAQVSDPVRDPVGRNDVSLAGVSHDGPRQYYEARVDEGETIVVQGRLRPSDDARLDVEKIGVQLSGRGLYIADSDRSQAIRRSALAAGVSLVLGTAALAVLAVLLGVVP